MSQVDSMRQLRRQGEGISSIARKAGVSRDTACKYLAEGDLSPRMPVKGHRPRKIDQYADVTARWLEDDLKGRGKQRHTAHRVWERLRDEYGADIGEPTVRSYVAEEKARIRAERDAAGYMDLEWPAGEAQAGLGEAGLHVRTARVRLSYLVLEFPHSNVGIAQVFPGENAECVCQALRNIFELIGGVPTKIVFDNATGAVRRVCDTIRLAEPFSGFAAHYGFPCRFCNPYSGNEKGAVENKAGTQRRGIFVPVPQVWDMGDLDARLPEKCLRMAEKDHYKPDVPETGLFEQDKAAPVGLPAKPYECVTYLTPKAGKKGKARPGGRHWRSTLPAHAGKRMIAAMRATKAGTCDSEGTFVCGHERSYGKAPTDTTDPGSQLGLPCGHIGAWENSKVHLALPDDLREHMDPLGKDDLRAGRRLLRDQWATSGWEATVQAAELALRATGRPGAASVAMAAASAAGGPITYDEPAGPAACGRAPEVVV